MPWAGADGQIPDNPNPTIAILDPRFAIGESNGNGESIDGEKLVQIWDRVGGGLRQWRNSLILVAPDRAFWQRTEDAVREVLAYESVVGSKSVTTIELSKLELDDLRSRSNAKKDSLRTSVTTAYRWVFYPEERGLKHESLPVPATKGEKIADRVVRRLSDQDYGAPKILPKLGSVYFNSKIAPRLWKDESDALDLSDALRRFPQWTFLPILPEREETLRACVREGLSQGLWSVAIGDAGTNTYQSLIEKPELLDDLGTLFDGSASLVKGDMLQLIRDELRVETEPDPSEEPEQAPLDEDPGKIRETPRVIPSPKRLKRVKVDFGALAVAKTNNLQPYLFKVLQEQDAGAELSVSIEVSSEAGISQDILDQRIVEAFDQLGISVRWEEA